MSEIELIITIIISLVLIIVAGFAGFRTGYMYRKKDAENKIGSAEEEAKRILDGAEEKARKDADNIKKERIIEAKE